MTDGRGADPCVTSKPSGVYFSASRADDEIWREAEAPSIRRRGRRRMRLGRWMERWMEGWMKGWMEGWKDEGWFERG